MEEEPRDENYVLIGQFKSFYGLKGWFSVRTFTSRIENFLSYKFLIFKKNSTHIKCIIEDYSYINQQLFIKLNNYNDRTSIEFLKNSKIFVHKSSLPRLKQNEFYWNELIGLSVCNLDGVDFGLVENLIETGANDVLVVKKISTTLIPFIEKYIKKVNLKKKIIIVDWLDDY